MAPLNHIDILADDLAQLLRASRPCWASLDGAKILITGGSGFFGAWLTHSFSAAMAETPHRFEVHIVCRDPGRFLDQFPYFRSQKGFTFHAHDVRRPLPFRIKFDHIIHAATAASAQLNADEPRLMIDTIVQGTRHLLDYAVAQGTKSMTFVSSGAVYGRIPHGQYVTESTLSGPDVQNPRSAYGEAKRLAELFCAIYAKEHQMSISALRCFAFVGPFMNFDAHFAIGNFILDATSGRAPLIKGDERTVRSYLYGADLVHAILRTIPQHQGLGGYEVINIGSDVPVTIGELAEAVRDQFSIAEPVAYDPHRTRHEAIDWYVPSILKLREKFGFSESETLTTAIQKTGAWLRTVRIAEA